MRALAVVCLTLLAGSSRAAGPVIPAAPAPVTSRGLFITDGARTATDLSRRDRVVRLVDRMKADEVTLYGLKPFLEDAGELASLRSLLETLRAHGVRTITLPVAGPRRMQALEKLAGRPDAPRFDALVTELEYWNACQGASGKGGVRPCFARLQSLVASMRTFAAREGAATVKVGVYLGTPTPAEMQWIVGQVDFVTLDFPGTTPERAAMGGGERGRARRERALSFLGERVPTWPIVYVRGELPFVAPVRPGDVEALERRFVKAFADETGGGPAPFAGIRWFADDGFLVEPIKFLIEPIEVHAP